MADRGSQPPNLGPGGRGTPFRPIPRTRPTDPLYPDPMVPNAAADHGDRVPLIYGTTAAEGRFVMAGVLNGPVGGVSVAGTVFTFKVGRHNGQDFVWQGSIYPGEIAFAQGPIEGFTGRYWKNDVLTPTATLAYHDSNDSYWKWKQGLMAPSEVVAGITWEEHTGAETAAWPVLSRSWGIAGFTASMAVPLSATAHVRCEGIVSDGASFPSITAEVMGFLRKGGTTSIDNMHLDAHPADVINDILVRKGHPSGTAETDVGADGSVSSSYRRYCDAEEFYVSRRITDESGFETLDDLMLATNSTYFWSEGRLKVRPLGDIVLTGSNTGLIYVPVTSSTLIGHDDLMADDNPVTVSRRPDAEVFNTCPVTFLWRPIWSAPVFTGSYSEFTVVSPLDSDLASHGERRAEPTSLPWVHRERHALRVSRLMAEASVSRRNTYRLALGPVHQLLEPGDFLTLNEPALGLTGTVRITAIDPRDERWEIDAVEWPIGAFTATSLTSQIGDGLTNAPAQLTGSGTSAEAVASGTADLHRTARSRLPFNESFTSFDADDWFFNATPTGSLSVLAGSGSSGGNALQTVGQSWIISSGSIPYDPTRLYKFRARFRQTADDAGRMSCYIGFSGLDATGTLCNILGQAGNSNQHYAWIQGISASMGWVEAVSYYRGLSPATGTQNYRFMQLPNSAHPNVRWMRPMFITNYSAGSGTCLLDLLEVTEETIAGDALITGTYASSSAATANYSATIAFGSATVAFASATTAFTTASWAFSSATQAQATASAASTTASWALSSATNAQATASSAFNTASAAFATATLAFNSSSWLNANKAATDFSNAVDAAVSTRLLASGSVVSGSIASFAIVANHITASAITTGKIQAGAITSVLISASAIQGTHIQAEAISGTHIRALTISGTHIRASTISGTHISAGTISGSHIAAGTISGTHIAALTISGTHISAGTISGSHIAAGTISGTHIKASTISGTHIAAGTISGTHIAAATISGTHISASTITAGHLTLIGGDNAWPNGNSEIAPPAGADTTTSEFSKRAAGDTYSGDYCRALSGGILDHWIPANPGETYYLEAYAKSVDGGGVYGSLYYFRSDRTTVITGKNSNTIDANAYGRISCSLVAPTTASWLRARLQDLGTNAKADAIVLKRMADASLIVDGGIQARHVAADVLQTSNFQLSGSTPVSGARLDSSGTSLLVAAGNLQVGSFTFKDMFRQLGPTYITGTQQIGEFALSPSLPDANYAAIVYPAPMSSTTFTVGAYVVQFINKFTNKVTFGTVEAPGGTTTASFMATVIRLPS